MEGLGGGGISFIKRVSVKGFLFLPAPPCLPAVCLHFGGHWRLAATLRGRAAGLLSFPAASSACSPLLPLMGTMGGRGNPLGLVAGDPLGCPVVSEAGPPSAHLAALPVPLLPLVRGGRSCCRGN